MELKKRSDGGPVEPAEDAPRGKKPVVVYIMVLFIAAFLLMALSFFSLQRSNTVALGRIQSSVTVMQEVQELQDQVIALQEQLAESEEQIEELERQAELRDSEIDAYGRQYMALARLYSLERLYRQEDLEGCRKVIDGMEADGLTACLSGDLTLSEQELGLAVSAWDRYHQLKEAVEAREAEAGAAG